MGGGPIGRILRCFGLGWHDSRWFILPSVGKACFRELAFCNPPNRDRLAPPCGGHAGSALEPTRLPGAGSHPADYRPGIARELSDCSQLGKPPRLPQGHRSGEPLPGLGPKTTAFPRFIFSNGRAKKELPAFSLGALEWSRSALIQGAMPGFTTSGRDAFINSRPGRRPQTHGGQTPEPEPRSGRCETTGSVVHAPPGWISPLLPEKVLR
jgi:hypothetical protein